jgi:hypothetical protein
MRYPPGNLQFECIAVMRDNLRTEPFSCPCGPPSARAEAASSGLILIRELQAGDTVRLIFRLIKRPVRRVWWFNWDLICDRHEDLYGSGYEGYEE